MKTLNEEHGMLSDGFVHFTPEYYDSQNWRIKGNRIELVHFISDQKTLEGELIRLADRHSQILYVINHCLDYTFSTDPEWKSISAKLVRDGCKFGELFKRSVITRAP